MGRLLFLLFFVVAMDVSVFAQGTNFDSKNINLDPVSWSQDVDSTTEWGKWLIKVVKPYWDKIIIATKNVGERIASGIPNGLPTEKTVEEFRVNEEARINKATIDYCKDIRAIIPPSELSTLHSKFLDINCKYTLHEFMKDKDLQNKSDLLAAEFKTELKNILEKHGVPQKVIDEFIQVHK